MAIASPGTPTATSTLTTSGSDPPGTPAVPTPAMMHITATVICCVRVSSTPNTWARNSTVTPSYSAVPFWLALAPMVSTKRAMRGGSPRFFSATRSETGSVALLDAVANAITIASRDCWKN